MANKVYSMLGISTKAGSVVSGEFSVEKSVKAFKAYLVILASDASDNTKKHFKDMCSFREIPVYEYGDKESLGRAIGKEMRTSLGVTNEKLAANLEKLLVAEGAVKAEVVEEEN